LEKPYFILRFAKLGAHHDAGIKGISDEIAAKLVELLDPFGRVYITSERKLDTVLEPYRIQINPIDIHHVMAFAKIYIGDSQTMAAESGVLGVPFIRFNDFVGRISYLDELENKYQLGFGIKTNEIEKLTTTIKHLVNVDNLNELHKERRLKMLSEKIDYTAFLISIGLSSEN
jgi:predicted glycosyltransferase